jgi:beta-glucosidase
MKKSASAFCNALSEAAIVVAAAFLTQSGVCAQAAPQYPFQNPDLPTAQRVDDLVSRLSPAEKVSQMSTDAAAIPRLGIPKYYWWSECLHGNASAGLATVFPEPIGLAATFDLGLESEVASATSDEDRAKYNQTVRDNAPAPFQGLTFFAPNINIVRDPRWGRGQETYGEDPYLTSQFGVTFIRGLQGNDPKYLKVVATPKHFAVHSGPEPERHRFDAVVSDYDLHDTYLPAFQAAIERGRAQSIMGAYSAVDGIPDCASPLLLQTNLRQGWGFDGYVVSDCDAIGDIYSAHHYADSRAAAAADGVKAGCDLDCGGTYNSLTDALTQGLVTEAQIDVSVKRLFTARMRLGMFDPSAYVKYAQIPMSVIDSPAHRQIALRAARESVVLLKNENNFLPLSPKIKSLAVIGPNADAIPVLLGNYNGTPSHAVTVLQGLKDRAPTLDIEYAKGCDLTGLSDLSVVPDTALRHNGRPGLQAEYFSDQELQGAPDVTRIDQNIDFDWGKANPVPALPTQHISARWTGELIAPQAGDYTLSVRGDDGFRLFVDGRKVIDDWTIHPTESRSYQLPLKAQQVVPIKLEYFQAEGGAEIHLLWRRPTENPFDDAVAAAKRADAVVFVGGISSALEGEEGTNGNGDRQNLNLPDVQEKLLQALAAAGKPIVFVLLNGSAMSVNWAQAHVRAIVEAWYPGEEGGNGVADVLLGNYDPAGRLPVTFYKSTDQLPAFTDYAMKDRTYRYFTGEPLYPFGYGLSYTQFRYSGLKLPKSVKDGQGATVTAEVENVGSREGDEVTELYVRPAPNAALRQIAPDQPMPRLELASFMRSHLAPHERKTVSFFLTPEQLRLVNAKGERSLQPGTWQIFVGGRQPSLSKAGTQAKDIVSGYLRVR